MSAADTGVERRDDESALDFQERKNSARRIEPQNRVVISAEAYDGLRHERDDLHDRTARYAKLLREAEQSMEAQEDRIRALMDLATARLEAIFEIATDADHDVLKTLTDRLDVQAAALSDARWERYKALEAARKLDHEHGLYYDILDHEGLIDEYGCPECEDELRAPGESLCGTCRVRLDPQP